MIRLSCLLFFGFLALTIQSKTLDNPDFYGYSLTVNGRSINHDSFAMYTTGVLAFVGGDPGSLKPKPVLFRVTLRRAGTAVHQWPANARTGVYAMSLDEVWSVARFGDELDVEPVGTPAQVEAYGWTRRIIKLNTFNLLLINSDRC